MERNKCGRRVVSVYLKRIAHHCAKGSVIKKLRYSTPTYALCIFFLEESSAVKIRWFELAKQ